MQVNILEARSQLSQLIKSAQAGEEVIIANRGQPVARLVPVGAPAVRQAHKPAIAVTPTSPARAGGIVKWLEANPMPAYLRRSAEEIDAAIEEERNAWD